MSEAAIRRMTLRDVDAVHAIEAATFSKPWTREDFVKEMTQNACARYLVAECGGEIVGFAGAWIVLDEAHVTNIAVRSDHRGKGIGKRLMDKAKEVALRQERRAIILETQSCNTNAIGFYLHQGFELIGFDTCCYTNNDIGRREVRINLGYFFHREECRR